ncbi:MAG TPA: hypothetical protein VFA89_20090 [Terriglobales bacterium]|nr:hypothetical protein [Terriglobales bacterium]
MKSVCLLLALACFGSVFSFSQTETCPAGTEDMLNYFVMGYPNRLSNYMGPGNANPIYSAIVPEDGSQFATTGYFVWSKSASGYPWDVKSFDSKYVYDRTTELSWTDPTSFRRFTRDLPMTVRCVTIGKAGRAIKVDASNTSYSFYTNCQAYQTSPLNYVLNELSAPSTVTTGNLGTITARYFRYHYGCDQNYANCTDMEVFSLGYGVGLYDWKHYVAQNGKWQSVQDSIINNQQPGQTVPYLPCSNSYQ